MAKKIRHDEDDFEDELESEETEETTEIVEEEPEEESESEIKIDDDDENINIVIEIDDEDINDLSTSDEPQKGEEESDIVLSKHKIEGKHTLKYDSIFKGKKEDPLDENDPDNNGYTGNYFKETIEVDKASNYYFESIDNEAYIRSKLVKERVYAVLSERTSLNFLNNRRKPSRVDFNNYYSLLKTNLTEESFTNIELFNELSVYFSDNLFNMFKLLDNKWRNLIITELQDHIGKSSNSKEITNRNIYPGTEIEFTYEDYDGPKHITGDVVDCDYKNSMFKVNSYERIYEINIDDITKILNNTKFKYNLNKLNNIDFL
jgi:hypothetical protein